MRYFIGFEESSRVMLL